MGLGLGLGELEMCKHLVQRGREGHTGEVGQVGALTPQRVGTRDVRLHGRLRRYLLRVRARARVRVRVRVRIRVRVRVRVRVQQAPR